VVRRINHEDAVAMKRKSVDNILLAGTSWPEMERLCPQKHYGGRAREKVGRPKIFARQELPTG